MWKVFHLSDEETCGSRSIKSKVKIGDVRLKKLRPEASSLTTQSGNEGTL